MLGQHHELYATAWPNCCAANRQSTNTIAEAETVQPAFSQLWGELVLHPEQVMLPVQLGWGLGYC